MLSIAKSRLTLPAQTLFLASNALGLVLGAVYARRTPELYAHNSHGRLGWVLSWIVSAWVVLGLVRRYGARAARAEQQGVGAATHPVSVAALAQYTRVQQAPTLHSASPSPSPGGEARWSRDSGQGTERGSESLFGHSRSPSDLSETRRFEVPGQRYDHGHDEDDDEDEFDGDAEKKGFLRNAAVDRFLTGKLAGFVSCRRTLQVVNFLYIAVERTIPILGFVAISTGAIVLGGIARGGAVFNVLAHFIKGGIFFWYGVLTLGRWLGSFADAGWAWNVKPPPGELVGRRCAALPTAEFTESFVIFLYGSTNVFLEHLAAWGDAWTPQDLEHVSISVMFFGGGLLGMLVESTRIRGLLNAYILQTNKHTSSDTATTAFTPPKTYKVSLNPIPALIILLLGVMMSSHHQDSMLSTMVHKQWGTMFVGFALARAVTYMLVYLAPPTSYLPSRPPSELISAFCLTAGGITFILSNKDTVACMEQYGLDAMFTFTVTVGLTCLVLSWATVLCAIKGWATRREHPRQVAFLTREVGMPA
ncbi:hypothetical protein EJ05DRAFT_244565 [Pseudovirgaria hyperparasitica]|uniref:Integral membrane protein n=1 Tax=Pseudovirgaria hyperparasitica TaxID=470096 RepID=A0A6A6WIA4_9PEZI|nr:uncharacterized protein EJ05DRAFT_244565 [Pseudovirgaria hyperparasitica]KAF2760871.1 hypothetical protein EJ05DRAFT_244565 [Pseudovirgaria hyperparasitica]